MKLLRDGSLSDIKTASFIFKPSGRTEFILGIKYSISNGGVISISKYSLMPAMPTPRAGPKATFGDG